jgi:hypothetical protein
MALKNMFRLNVKVLKSIKVIFFISIHGEEVAGEIHFKEILLLLPQMLIKNLYQQKEQKGMVSFSMMTYLSINLKPMNCELRCQKTQFQMRCLILVEPLKKLRLGV